MKGRKEGNKGRGREGEGREMAEKEEKWRKVEQAKGREECEPQRNGRWEGKERKMGRGREGKRRNG